MCVPKSTHHVACVVLLAVELVVRRTHTAAVVPYNAARLAVVKVDDDLWRDKSSALESQNGGTGRESQNGGTHMLCPNSWSALLTAGGRVRTGVRGVGGRRLDRTP